ncbi:MAG TPA: fumarylacetoacetase [Acidimicrobiales bacterium]|nr:fumarylacetoacetase [Acidimicrobiales bacterium]
MLTSWVVGADGSGFPAEHLPYGVFAEPGGVPRVGARIGDHVVDLARLAQDRVLDGPFAQPSLNGFMAEGPARWRLVRETLTELVCNTDFRDAVGPALLPLDAVALQLPFTVADYVDFYSSIHHATNVGRLFRPDAEPLLPNWRHLPVGYHGRAGTVVVSGSPVVRPSGQLGPGPDGAVGFGPSARLDIELEVGFVVGVPSMPARPVTVATAPAHVFGVVLVNDWSARDVQAWEYQPLGPFLGKSFATSVSAWVTPLAALSACRVPGPRQEPPPLPHLAPVPEEPWGLALDLAVDLRPSGVEADGGGDPATVSATSFADMYWQFPQQIAHLTSNGAHLRNGDLLASGTVSGPTRGSEGSLLELTRGGAEPLVVGGATRSFLEDGDEVTLRGSAAVAPDVTLTLGEVRGRIVPA